MSKHSPERTLSDFGGVPKDMENLDNNITYISDTKTTKDRVLTNVDSRHKSSILALYLKEFNFGL